MPVRRSAAMAKTAFLVVFADVNVRYTAVISSAKRIIT